MLTRMTIMMALVMKVTRSPEDPSEFADTDGDGIGDNEDQLPVRTHHETLIQIVMVLVITLILMMTQIP